VLWRIDKNEVGSGFATARVLLSLFLSLFYLIVPLKTNLLKLFTSNDPLTIKRRRLIVDLESPEFDTHPNQPRPTNSTSTTPTKPTSTSNPTNPTPSPSRYKWAAHSDFATLNVDQRKAINTVLSAKDYALILGMPGTGKVKELRREAAYRMRQ
jgi:hypothetical protein